MTRNKAIFIIGFILILIPTAVKLYMMFGPLPKAPNHRDPISITDKFNYVISYSDLIVEPNIKTYHLLEYRLFINTRNSSNPFKFPSGSIEISAVYNCSTKKHFFKAWGNRPSTNFHGTYIGKIINDNNINKITQIYSDYIENTNFINTLESTCPIVLNTDIFDVPRLNFDNNFELFEFDMRTKYFNLLKYKNIYRIKIVCPIYKKWPRLIHADTKSDNDTFMISDELNKVGLINPFLSSIYYLNTDKNKYDGSRSITNNFSGCEVQELPDLNFSTKIIFNRTYRFNGITN